jgi:hypothetical protein
MNQRKHSAKPPSQARRPPRAQAPTLTVLHPNAAGIDVHADMHNRRTPAGRDEGGQPVGVLAVGVTQVSGALAGTAVAVEVDVVALLVADLLDQEAAAEVGGDLGQEVVLRGAADADADDAGRAVGRPDAQADGAGGPRLPLPGAR